VCFAGGESGSSLECSAVASIDISDIDAVSSCDDDGHQDGDAVRGSGA
jgi:hypothetical protein